jgi:hypothetical protein
MNPDGRSKTPRLETKMKKNLHPQPDHRERLLIPVSEFSFAACPILINHAHPNLSDAAGSPNPARRLRRNALRQRITRVLRWALGKPAAVPAAGNLSLDEAVS